MEREVVRTADGSMTLQIKEWAEQYHSMHGAVQEAYHVFIKHGLSLFGRGTVSILEIGFGTGLNALITLLEATKMGVDVHYTGVERYPVTAEEVGLLDYIAELKAQKHADHFKRMHDSPWETPISITKGFSFQKLQKDFRTLDFVGQFDLVYFDAFGARVQPELWTEEMFSIMFKALKNGGVLVTYAAKGSARRAMQAVGFTVERLPGPPGKREMLRARKILPQYSVRADLPYVNTPLRITVKSELNAICPLLKRLPLIHESVDHGSDRTRRDRNCGGMPETGYGRPLFDHPKG